MAANGRGISGGEPGSKLGLPFGLEDRAGGRARTAVLTAITGHSELSGADDGNPFRTALHVLAASTLELGPYRGAELTPALLGQLLPVDRDYLLVQLDRLTFGDVRYQTVACPRAECRRRLDIRFALSSVERPELGAHAGGVIELADGRIDFRWPVAADQAALHEVEPAALEAEFLRRCVRARDGHLDWSELMARPAAVRAEVVARIVAASPSLDLEVPLACVACERPFRFVFDPVASLSAELKASRAELIKQVHRLALSYHWSQAEILALPRPLRHEYLTLVMAEAGR